MEKVFMQYASIASQWTPSNPIRAFLPFVYHYIKKKQPKHITLEEISIGIDELFGLHLTYPLLRSILQYLKNNSEATLQEYTYWEFNLVERKEMEIESDQTNQSELLLKDFLSFVQYDIDMERAEDLFDSFFRRYDYEIFNGQFSTINSDKFDNYDYFVAEYIKHLENTKSNYFDYILKIAQGSIIKSTITSENLKLTIFNKKVFYFDTKVIFRLLGYYGKYYEKEYRSLIEELQKQQAVLMITDYVYDEILSILRGCAKYIDNAEYQYEKASDVLRYFRSLKLTKLDIQEKINTFETTLKKEFGIHVDREDIYSGKNLRKSEDYNKLRQILVDKYGYSDNEYEYVYQNGVETDLKSILHAYLRRNKNDCVLIKDSPLFFVTTNGSLVKSVMQYNLEEYGKYISPIISDTFLGVILYNVDNNLKGFCQLKLMSFCNEAFKPNTEQREKFIRCVEKASLENRITENDTFLLKHYELIDDVLVNQLRLNDFNINDDCVYNSLEEIKHDLVIDITKSYDRKINEIENKNEEELKDQKDKYEKEIEKIKIESERNITELNQNYKEEIDRNNKTFDDYKKEHIQQELKPYTKTITVGYYIISSIILLASIFVCLIPVIFNTEVKWYSILYIVGSIIIFIVDIIAAIIEIKSKKILNFILEKKRQKLHKKYDYCDK